MGDRLGFRHSVASGKVAIYPVKRVKCEKRKGSEKTNCEQQVLLIRSHKCSKARPKYFSCKRPEVRLLASPRARVRSIQINPNPKSLIGSSINTPPSREPLTPRANEPIVWSRSHEELWDQEQGLVQAQVQSCPARVREFQSSSRLIAHREKSIAPVDSSSVVALTRGAEVCSRLSSPGSRVGIKIPHT